MAIYLDSSAALKLAVAEAESEALRAELSGCTDGFVSSTLLSAELRRAALRSLDPVVALEAVTAVISGVRLVRIDDDIVAEAGVMLPPLLRTLDAIHLATALSLGAAVEFMACYDRRLGDAAQAAGLEVRRPE